MTARLPVPKTKHERDVTSLRGVGRQAGRQAISIRISLESFITMAHSDMTVVDAYFYRSEVEESGDLEYLEHIVVSSNKPLDLDPERKT